MPIVAAAVLIDVAHLFVVAAVEVAILAAGVVVVLISIERCLVEKLEAANQTD